jgi:hypothetical protein
MKPHRPNIWIVPCINYRRRMPDAYGPVHQKKMIHCLCEVDVFMPHAALRAHYTETGASLSISTYLAKCLEKAVDEYKAVQSYRERGKDDVDIYMVIERDEAGQKQIVPYTIPATHHTTLLDLHHEVRAVKRSAANGILKQFWYLYLPTAVFRPFLFAFVWVGKQHPRLWNSIVGTAVISTAGTFGNAVGWSMPLHMPTTLMRTVGGVDDREVTMDDHTTVRVYLSHTISADCDIVDGAPTARFTERLKELIERGYGLDEGPRGGCANQHPAAAASPIFLKASRDALPDNVIAL